MMTKAFAKQTHPAADMALEIEKIKKQADEYLNGWKRALADYENLKKSQVKHQDEVGKYLVSEIFTNIIPIMEHYETALEHIPGDLRGSSWYEGLRHLRTQWRTLLAAYHIEIIRPEGELFDPALHEAVGTKTVPDRADNEVLGVAANGYRIAETMIRPARVVVNKLSA